MSPIKITLQDYLIAGVGIATLVMFQGHLVIALGTTPKMIDGLGVLVACVIMLGLTIFKLSRCPRQARRDPVWQRLAGLPVLAAGVTYFFFREEVADALNWRIEVGDSLATLIGLIAVTWIVTQQSKNDGEDE